MNTHELKLFTKLYHKLGELESSLESLCEICQDTAEINSHEFISNELHQWRSNIADRLPLPCPKCGKYDWREEKLIQLRSHQRVPAGHELEAVWRGVSNRYVCVACNYVLVR